MICKPFGEEYRVTTVCIDSYEAGVLSGRFYNPYIQEGVRFESGTQFLLKMENLLEQMELPKSFTAFRAFAPLQERTRCPVVESGREGLQATFRIRILFRQNASWQGSVTWVEGKQEQSFRSVLELLLLMDSAMSQKKAS